jgi:hypothetical protein
MQNRFISIDDYQLELIYDENLTWQCPSTIQNEYEQALDKWLSQIRFNSVRAKPYRFRVNKKNKTLRVLAGPFTYAQTRALQDCMQNPANHHLSELSNEISSMSLTVSVASSDNKILMAKRSLKVSRYADCWSMGLGEGLEEKDFKQGDIVQSVHRALVEELNFEPDDYPEIRCLAVSFSEDSSSMNILALADLRHSEDARHTSDAIVQRAQYAHDAWEHSQLVFINPDLISLNNLVGNDNIAPNNELYFNELIKKF